MTGATAVHRLTELRRLTRSIGAAGTLYHVVRFSILGAVTVAWAGFWNDISLGLIILTFGAPGLAVAGIFIALLVNPSERKTIVPIALFSTFVIFSTDIAAVTRYVVSQAAGGGLSSGLAIILGCDGFLGVVLLVFGVWHRRTVSGPQDQAYPAPEVEEVENP